MSKTYNIMSNNTGDNEEINDILETNWDEKVSSFDSLDLKEDLLRGIYAFGFERPSEIQQLAIKPVLMGRDIIAQARSGTGKTGTFGIGVLERIDTTIDIPQALILAPTRELVDQIKTVISNLGIFINVKVEGFVGGKSIKDDITKLNQTQKFEILQNPVVNGIAQVKYSNAKGGTLYIYDMTGKMLKTQPLKTAAGQEVISVSTLQKGVYMIMLKSEQGVSTSKFIIK